MSSARGAAGAVKPKLHNVNSIYAGKNQNAVKAPGSGKHGGLQSLGKTTAVVRRMPPPATLPSLRAESQGQDPNVALVPQGGSGWAKGDTNITNGSTTDSQLGTSPTVINSSAALNSGNLGSSAAHSTDLRPKWAKQTNSTDAQSAIQSNPSASSRDFPSLAAATATTFGKGNASLTESLKPQKSGSWRAGGGSSASKTEGTNATITAPPYSGTSTYPTASSLVRATERQLPARYYDTTPVPPPPPSGTFQVPKQQPLVGIASSKSNLPAPNANTDTQIPSAEIASNQTVSTASVAQVSAGVTAPPPNYSQPPPNFAASQSDPMRDITGNTTQQQAFDESYSQQNERYQQQKSGPGGEGYNERKYRQTLGCDTRSGMLEGTQICGSSDVRNMMNSRKEFYENRAIPLEDYPLEWSNNAYGYSESENDSRRWRNPGGNGLDSQRYVNEFSQNGFDGTRSDGRQQNMEREAAIERSRQKRRIASQSSAISENETSIGSPNVYGSVRMMSAYENDVYPEWEQDVCDSNAQQKAAECVVQSQQQQRWNEISGAYDEKDCAPRTEYRMLRRPDSKEVSEVVQHFSQMMLTNELQDDEEEFQLTKLSRPSTKIVKRVAPNVGGVQLCDNSGVGHVAQVQNKNVSTTIHQRKMYQKSTDRNSSDSIGQQGQGQYQRETNSTSTSEWCAQNQKAIPRTQSQLDNLVTEQQFQTNTAVAPPTDNVWEKRAEERESAERERLAHRETLLQMRMQQHFPTVGEQSIAVADSTEIEQGTEIIGTGRNKDVYTRNNEQHPRKHNRNRRDGQRWNERKYSGTIGSKDDGGEDQGTNGIPFRGQREFVNSRVHRSGRGSSLVGTRGGRGHARLTYPNVRRGGSVPQQHQGARTQNQRYDERGTTKRGGRRMDMQLAEKDNFSNMGEFHVEDTYATAPSTDAVAEKATDESLDLHSASAKFKEQQVTSGRRVDRQRTTRGSHRDTQQLYEPRKSQEYSRSGRRGNRGGNVARKTGAMERSSEVHSSGSYHNAPEREQERERRKRNFGDEKRDSGENKSEARASMLRLDSYRRGGGSRSGQQHGMRRRRHSPHEANASNTQSGQQASGQIKSPVVSEGHEEWETASESSDVAQRQPTQRRTNPLNKYSTSRRMMRSTNEQQRNDNNTGNATNRVVSGPKNVKPASITSHAAARNAVSTKEDIAAGTAELNRRDTCKDGLAGVDINNAGVIVIDDRPDGQLEDVNENNDDFEEVLSKKSRKLRQQQINEQAEAEERRRQKEKEKMERRKARTQTKRVERRVNASYRGAIGAKNMCATNTNEAGVTSASAGSDHCSVFGTKTTEIGHTQSILNTTVWNSSIVREQAIRSSPPLESRQVIPSPIARPTPKTSTSSAIAANAEHKTELDLWTGTVDDKLGEAAAKRNSVEFTANFNSGATHDDNGRYDFTFDPSLQENTSTVAQQKSTTSNGKLADSENLVPPTNEAIGLGNVALQANDDECLKQRLDKVKDFWPGQQQFSNNLLGNSNEKRTMTPLVPDKNASNSIGASSMPHGPNVAKVRPQPQTSEQTAAVAGSVKDIVISSTPSLVSLPPSSPIACLPPGAYLQSLSQVPPPATFPHCSMIFGEAYNPNSSSAQTLFGAGMNSMGQAQSTRSRPGSYLEQSQLFVHPPPSATTNNLTWSTGTAQMELLGAAGISATPPLAQPQAVSAAAQRFQMNSPRSASTFGTLTSVIGNNAKLTHIGPPPPPPPPPPHHQMPPPIPPPHNFMAPPPDFVPLPASNLGAVGSQRGNDSSASGAFQRQVPPPLPPMHVQQQPLNFTQHSHSGFSTGTTTFNQAPPVHHTFTAPPPPLRYPALPQLTTNEIGNMVGSNSWARPSTVVTFKYANGSVPPVTRSTVQRSQHVERWALPANVQPHYPVVQNCQPHQQQQSQQQQHASGKDSLDGIQANMDRYQSGPTPDNCVRTSSASSVAASGGADALDSSSQQKKATKV